jgi:hypothetical protein
MIVSGVDICWQVLSRLSRRLENLAQQFFTTRRFWFAKGRFIRCRNWCSAIVALADLVAQRTSQLSEAIEAREIAEHRKAVVEAKSEGALRLKLIERRGIDQ